MDVPISITIKPSLYFWFCFIDPYLLIVPNKILYDSWSLCLEVHLTCFNKGMDLYMMHGHYVWKDSGPYGMSRGTLGCGTIPCIRIGSSCHHPNVLIRISWDISYPKYWDGAGWRCFPCVRIWSSCHHPNILIGISWDISYPKYWDGAGWRCILFHKINWDNPIPWDLKPWVWKFI